MKTRFFENNEKGIIQKELVSSVKNMMTDANFNITTFYSYLDKIISSIDDEQVYYELRYLILTGPTCYFGAIYYILKYNILDNSCDKEFEYLKNFNDYEIEVYMLVNFVEYNDDYIK